MKNMKTTVAFYMPINNINSLKGGGGAERRLSYLFSHMNKDKYIVNIVIKIKDNYENLINSLDNYVRNCDNIVFVNNCFEAFRHFKEMNYDYVFYTDSVAKSLPAAIGAKIVKSNNVLIFVTENYSRWVFESRLKKVFMHINVNLAKSIDCLYPANAPVLRTYFPKKQISVTPCSLPNLSTILNDSINIKNKKKTIVFAARLIKSKNPLFLIDAADLILTSLKNNGYKIIICGDGPLKREIQIRLLNPKYNGLVSFKGSQEMIKIFHAASVFCSLQENENYPSQSLLEAIACGCFCIATNVGDTARIIKEDFGKLISKNTMALAAALEEAMSFKDEKYHLIKIAAQSFAKKMFEPQNAIIHYEKLCNKSKENGLLF